MCFSHIDASLFFPLSLKIKGKTGTVLIEGLNERPPMRRAGHTGVARGIRHFLPEDTFSGDHQIPVTSQKPPVVAMALPPFFAPGRPGPPPPQPLPPAPFGCPPPPLPSPAFPPPLPQRPGPFPGASAPFLQPPLAVQPRAPGEASRGGGGGSGGAFYPVPPPPLPPPPPQCRPFPGIDAGERPRPPPPGPGPPWSPRWPEAPPPDVLGDSALQRLRDRQWLEAVFGAPRRAGCPPPPRAPAGPTLGEVRARVRGALRLVRRLRELGQALREAEADGAAWALLHAQAAPLRAELAERLQLLTQAAYVGEARRRLERVRRRRLRLRERAREREAEREAEAARAAEREQEIDRWRVKCVQEVEEKKREQELKAAADGVLSEVRKKQADTKRMVDILRALEKLRKLRKEAAARKGMIGISTWCHLIILKATLFPKDGSFRRFPATTSGQLPLSCISKDAPGVWTRQRSLQL
ncbi:programmed cell death protein 7 isoform X5 [Myotis myotis]|uniref:programmed cell death protein 7 isoform X5 n=1 Tax=Myotis myotis TaxID=51298 RepID=UPI0017498E0A|nr:programmed cell death protein 7 isoform X5 [Myotis myotis]